MNGGGAPAGLFAGREPQPDAAPLLPWVIAGVVILAVAVALILGGRRIPRTREVMPADPRGAALVFSGLTMSESESLSGGKSTYVDGTVRNTGPATIRSATLQALFSNDQGMPPQVETLPLALIRTRQPYVDTQPVSAAPLTPGAEREFRLIFEGVGSNWNQQPPELHVVHVSTQ